MNEPTPSLDRKVNTIHIGNLDAGIIIGWDDGSMENLPMNQNCYREQQEQTESFAKAIGSSESNRVLNEFVEGLKDYALDNLEHSLSVSIAADEYLLLWRKKQ